MRDPLESLAQLAGLEKSEATARLAQSAAELLAKQQEAERLRGYMKDYLEQSQAGAAAAASTRWLNARLFVERLRIALTSCERDLETVLRRYQADIERWRAAYGRDLAVEALIERQQREAFERDERAAQRELDEQAARPRK